MSKRAILTGAFLLLAWVAVSCDHAVYEITMTPGADGTMHRRLVAYHQDGVATEPTSEDLLLTAKAVTSWPDATSQPQNTLAQELKTLRKIYTRQGELEDTKGGKYVFSDTFTGTTPDDVGGAGYFKHYPTIMGTAWAYTERFRGDDKPYDMLQAQARATDRIAELIGGWLEQRYAKSPDLPKLKVFIETAKTDMRNLAGIWFAYSCAGRLDMEDMPSTMPSGISKDHMFIRMTQYLLERNYVSAEISESYALLTSGDLNPSAYNKWFGHILTVKAGITDKAILDDWGDLEKNGDKLDESLGEYLRQTPEFKAMIMAREEAATQPVSLENTVAVNPSDQPQTQPKPLDPNDVLTGLFQEAVPADIGFTTDDQVLYKLVTTTKPARTNGHYDESTGAIGWFHFVKPRNATPQNLPALNYALWALPDGDFQKTHFGKVILEGQELWDFCIWHAALTPAQAKQFDSFLAGINPNDNVSAKFEAFCKSIEATPAATTQPYQHGLDLITGPQK